VDTIVTKRRMRVVFFDLDNTLYDWARFFAPAMRGMCVHLSGLTGIPSSQLYMDFRNVFAEHGSVEYSWALQELSSLRKLHPGANGPDIVQTYRTAIDVFQHRRRKWLKLYPGVAEGLRYLRDAGIGRIAVTDAHKWQSANRIRQLKLDRLIDGLVAREDHADPSADEVAEIRRFSQAYYETGVRRFDLPEGLRKPNPDLLLWLLKELDLKAEDCMYVGDSLPKDIAMAQAVGLLDCWAQYGTGFSSVDMWTLSQVTPWSAAAVEANLRPVPEHAGIYPTLIASSFGDVVDYATEGNLERERGGRGVEPSADGQFGLVG
jgi:FMN phosphatase YigB (HAD superfamily)